MSVLALVAAMVAAPQSPPLSGGQELLNALHSRMQKVQAVKFEMGFEAPGEKIPEGVEMPKMAYLIARDGRMRMAMPGMLMVVSGGQMLMLDEKKKTYMSAPVPGDAMLNQMPFPGLEGLNPKGKPAKAAGDPRRVKLGDQEAFAVPITSSGPFAEGKTTLYIAVDGSRPLGFSSPQGKQDVVITYKNLVLDPDLSAESLSTTPPAGYKEREGADTGGESSYDASLLKKGTKAPNFEGKTAQGAKTSLAALTKGKKGTVVNFWFYG
jgi:outer membrane lipoprotein-sorting protein